MSDFYLSVHKNVKFIVGKLYENNKNNYKIEEKIGIFTNKIIKMNREEFNELILRELTTEEFLNINPRLYLNPDYIEHYIAFHNGEYDKCYIHLMENRKILTDKNFIPNNPAEFFFKKMEEENKLNDYIAKARKTLNKIN